VAKEIMVAPLQMFRRTLELPLGIFKRTFNLPTQKSSSEQNNSLKVLQEHLNRE